jgi:glucose/arabinose dehydrogenase
MPAFGEALSLTERKALVQYIRELGPSLRPASGAGRAKEVAFGSAAAAASSRFRLEQVADGFEVPWSLAFLPDGRLLVTERAGRLRLVDHGVLSPPIRGIPHVHYRQDAGLLSLALDPDYVKNGWIYLSYSEPGAAARTSMTKVIRGRIRDGSWVDQQEIWQAAARYYQRGDDHYGCRLLFIEGKLFFSVGDRGDRRNAQDLLSPCGKIHRILPDGKIPADNPFAARADACPSVWSYGHRNPQGLTLDPTTGVLWETEHGPMGGDELNRIVRGGNYGWPVVTFGLEHDGSVISRLTTRPGMIDPVWQWTPSLGVCPVHRIASPLYAEWHDNLLVGTLAREEVRKLRIEDGRVAADEILLKDFGRVRDITTGPDGMLYFAVEHRDRPGEIVRLLPAGG